MENQDLNIKVNVRYIELFAGCGGLSLGFKSVGCELEFANELSPMAAESYAYNLLSEDLTNVDPIKRRTLWLSSAFGPTDIGGRLRENPTMFPPAGQGHSDLSEDGGNIKNSLIVGSIVDFNKWLEKRPKVKEKIKNCFGRGTVDVVSGGPPCQSFSMAGQREKGNQKNSLPWEFVKFVDTVKPKIALLENVTGILRPFSGNDGVKYFAWIELAKAFSHVGYVPLCLHVNAKYVGVPQNRPRFILLGIREDIFKALKPKLNSAERTIFAQPFSFYLSAKCGIKDNLDKLRCVDVTSDTDWRLMTESFLKPLVQSKMVTSVKEAIHDLRYGARRGTSKFSHDLGVAFDRFLEERPLSNHEFRSNSEHVRRRFRLYQVLEKMSKPVRRDVLQVLKGGCHELSAMSWESIKNEDFFIDSDSVSKFSSKAKFISFVVTLQTKKQSQRALSAMDPAPAALSIPDDACHYDPAQLRTLSVREMARIQSFPDNFVFRSKVTTGGQMRAFEVPQYTQVGNAVPPLLGRALALTVKNLLSRI